MISIFGRAFLPFMTACGVADTIVYDFVLFGSLRGRSLCDSLMHTGTRKQGGTRTRLARERGGHEKRADTRTRLTRETGISDRGAVCVTLAYHVEPQHCRHAVTEGRLAMYRPSICRLSSQTLVSPPVTTSSTAALAI